MTTFGEIVEPGSRVAWEDWDEINQEANNNPKLEWQQDVVVPKEMEALLLLEGKYLSDFISNKENTELEYVNSIIGANLHLYKITTTKYLCTIKDYNLVLSSEIVELLKEYINVCTDVITMMTKPLVDYQICEANTKQCVIRSLCTSVPISNTHKINFPNLEQPNIISGVAAGVVCLRESQKRPATAIVCYIDFPEDYQINEINSIFQNLNITPVQKNTDNILKSNLYI